MVNNPKEQELESRRQKTRLASTNVIRFAPAAAMGAGAWAWWVAEGSLRVAVSLVLLGMIIYVVYVEVIMKRFRHTSLSQALTDHTLTGASVNTSLKHVYNHVPVPILFLRRDGFVIGANTSFYEETQFDDTALSVGQWIDERYKAKLSNALSEALDGSEVQLELLGYHNQGFPQDWIAHIARMPDCVYPNPSLDHPLFSVCLQDASPDRHMAERIRYMSYYDDMTGLPNRRMFMQRLEEALNMAANASFTIVVMYMDLDRFKRINDTFGTDFGDMLLMQCAERLLRSMTDNDVVARMEGDEFACFLTYIESEQEMHERVRQCLAVMEEPFYLNDIPVHVTMSIGVTIIDKSQYHAKAGMAIKQADLALSRVKEQGKNGYLFYTSEMNDRPLERITLENDMRIALTKEEFELFYQPQVDMNSQQIVGVEALVRWNHPERGLISPGDFIPLAEENGFIVALGTWVMEEACRQNMKWQNIGLPPIPVSVNLSVRQFEMKNLAETVRDVLIRTGLEPRYLDLEITESMTLDVSRASHILKKLKDMGVAISIDDFGTGYSSLHYLKNFPIHRLKIDRSFVRDLEHDPNDAAIVSAIIALGHNMNMQVIAEGVETEDQLLFLQKHRCDEIQGYYFSPPLSCQRFEELFRRHCKQEVTQM
ncbi:EAL domain-containing protein [Paenibacillus profundus]|uniref:EAL domain-containing protein n=1 Tax=Paenibacillus profundus TaxID=1173085 RepID=A0ABS8YHM4_9BACL|nr:EAL domain-containing protein [Paenibacillus profundus]MCE5171256.1 EAL domain-containing protein [Paenibacillus profundus]